MSKPQAVIISLLERMEDNDIDGKELEITHSYGTWIINSTYQRQTKQIRIFYGSEGELKIIDSKGEYKEFETVSKCAKAVMGEILEFLNHWNK